MKSWPGLACVVLLSMGWALPARAQSVDGPYGLDPASYGPWLDRLGPAAGFGLETVRAPLAGTIVVDRFGLPHAVALPAAPPRRAVRTGTKASRSAPTGRAGRGLYSLPTGSLDWAGTRGVILYSPALRYQDFGSGLGRGPYGSVDCGIMYKGWPLRY